MPRTDSSSTIIQLRILIVEDEALIRWAVAEELSAAGHQVLEAGDAATARRLVAEAREPLDAVLLDLRLPDSSDLSLLPAIRHQSPATAIVMMTAHGTREVMSKASESGVQTIVLKPFTPGELAEGVAKAVGQLGTEPPPPA